MIKRILFVLPCMLAMTIYSSNAMAMGYDNCDTTQDEKCIGGTPNSGRNGDSPNLYCYETTDCGCGYRSKSECDKNKGTYQTCCKKKGGITDYCYRTMTCVSCVNIGNDWIIDYYLYDRGENACYQNGGSPWQNGLSDGTGTYNAATHWCSAELYSYYDLKCYVAVDSVSECE